MQVLGLTGGIGSGKSTVAKIFRVLGVPVYNSDLRAHEIYFEKDVRKQVIDLLGKEAYTSERELNKELIREKIFADESLLKKINAVIHPAVKRDFEKFKKQHSDKAYIIKETALLFEAGIADSVDKILLVTADQELRTKRVMQRDNVDAISVGKIIEKQLPDSEKKKRADWVLENNEEKLMLPQVIKIHQEMLEAVS